MKWMPFGLVLAFVTGCDLSQTDDKSDPDIGEAVTMQKEFPPQVWSDHKLLEMSESECADKGIEILSSLGFSGVVKSSHGAYVYGNYSNNRSAIKCITIEDITLAYVVVAGPEVEIVEKLRNEIMWQL